MLERSGICILEKSITLLLWFPTEPWNQLNLKTRTITPKDRYNSLCVITKVSQLNYSLKENHYSNMLKLRTATAFFVGVDFLLIFMKGKAKQRLLFCYTSYFFVLNDSFLLHMTSTRIDWSQNCSKPSYQTFNGSKLM